MNIETALALIVAIITLLSTTLNTFLTKRYELSMKKLELKQKHLETNYANSLEVFQVFVSETTKILDHINNKTEPMAEDIQRFEVACIACYLFLNAADRKEFQNFRVEVKLKLGYEDPREYNIGQMLVPLASLQFRYKAGQLLFSSFNNCLNIANRELVSLTEQLKELT